MSENETSSNTNTQGNSQNVQSTTNNDNGVTKPKQYKRYNRSHRNNYDKKSSTINNKVDSDTHSQQQVDHNSSQNQSKQLNQSAKPFIPVSVMLSNASNTTSSNISAEHVSENSSISIENKESQTNSQKTRNRNNKRKNHNKKSTNVENNNNSTITSTDPNSSSNSNPQNSSSSKKSRQKKSTATTEESSVIDSNKEKKNTNEKQSNKNNRPSKNNKRTSGNRHRKLSPVKDSSTIEDLKERLEYELLHEIYACNICFNKVRRTQKIYSCPHCFGIIHLDCMITWVFKSLEDSIKQQIPKYINTPRKFLSFFYKQGFNTVESKCPRCREAILFSTHPSGCFGDETHCISTGLQEEKEHSSDISTNTTQSSEEISSHSVSETNEFEALTPHCCGRVCGRVTGDHCTHPCLLLCHAGPCPPCTVLVKKTCACGKEEVTVQCCNSQNDVHCHTVCGKLLSCKEHYCQQVCHKGECGKCTYPIDVPCYCGREHKIMNCGDIDYKLRSRYPDDQKLLKHYTPIVTKSSQDLINKDEKLNKEDVQIQDHIINKNLYANLSFDGLEDLSDEEDDEEEDKQETIEHDINNTQSTISEDASIPKYVLKTFKEAGVGGYSCHHICSKILPCQYHTCQKECHPGDCGECERILTATSKCPCGKCLCSELNPNRICCVEPIPTCTNICNKLLACGIHHCTLKCHEGPCPTCEKMVIQKCRCKYSKREVPCWVANNLNAPTNLSEEEVKTLRQPFLCHHTCGCQLSCKKHICPKECCEFRGIKPHDQVHVCTIPCNKLLNCGIHRCAMLCHPGTCLPCSHIYFEPLSCSCGRTVIQPPITCGTRVPECKYPCLKPCVNGHIGCPPHNCHSGPCPPCIALMDKMCVGQHQLVKHVPCWKNDITCNNICGRELSCGHICKRMCHPLPCDKNNTFATEGCGQACGALRHDCPHTCQAPCHPGQPCPNVPCECYIELTCPCGRRVEREKCMIGGLTPNETMSQEDIDKIYQDLRNRHLDCDEKCQIIMRNIRLATALQVGPALQQFDSDADKRRAYEKELLVCPYSKSLLIFVGNKPAFVEALVQTFDKLSMTRTPGKQVELPIYLLSYQKNVEELAEYYGIEISVSLKPQKITATLGTNPHRPELSLLEAFTRVDGLVQGTRIHPLQPLPEKATERDFASLYIYDYKRDFDRSDDLLSFFDAIFPRGKYHIRKWLPPNGILILFLTEEVARQAKVSIEQRNLHLRVDFWAEHPKKDTYADLEGKEASMSVELSGVKPKPIYNPSKYSKNTTEDVPLYYNPWSILETDSSSEEEEEEDVDNKEEQTSH